MNKNERSLFLALCRFQNQHIKPELLKYATPDVLGLLFFNRMQGVAFDVLKKNNALNLVNREFRTSLKGGYDINVEKNISYLKCIEYVSSIFNDSDIRLALLKGAVLSYIYPEGYRTSNDIDVLTSPKDVTKINNILSKNRFQQGYIRNDKFVAASRKEIIESKMMRGETVPYIKEMNLPGIKYLEVDINYSLDYKNNTNNTLELMLDRIVNRKYGMFYLPTLSSEDFLIHLCCHLYKEATTMSWIQMGRDMTLYKYMDIYYLVSRMNDTNINDFFNRAKELDLEKICSFAILQTSSLFGINNNHITNRARKELNRDYAFIDRVYSPSDNKTYIYKTKNARKRFFMNNRITDLSEE